MSDSNAPPDAAPARKYFFFVDNTKYEHDA